MEKRLFFGEREQARIANKLTLLLQEIEMIVFDDYSKNGIIFNPIASFLAKSGKCFLCVNISSFDMQTFIYFKHS